MIYMNRHFISTKITNLWENYKNNKTDKEKH